MSGSLSNKSHSVALSPVNSRCKYRAKIVPAGSVLPAPSEISGASDIPGKYLQQGEEELVAGDALFEGESKHHYHIDRGWTYQVSYVTESGELLKFKSAFSFQKAEMKSQGMAATLLKGNGDVAAMVRIVHGLRSGLTVTPDSTANL